MSLKPWEIPPIYNEAPATEEPGDSNEQEDSDPPVLDKFSRQVRPPATHNPDDFPKLRQRDPVPDRYKADPSKRDPNLVELPPRKINYYSDDKDSESAPPDSIEE